MDIGALSSQLRNLGPGSHGDLFPILKSLPARGVRVLYIAGDLDKKYVKLSEKVGKVAGISVEIIPGAGHILPLEAPAELAGRIQRFVEKE
jgi:pimeloyl-ACP methyl ester carboxylesterase